MNDLNVMNALNLFLENLDLSRALDRALVGLMLGSLTAMGLFALGAVWLG